MPVTRNNELRSGWQVKPTFTISLHNKDEKLLKLINRTLGVGKIYKHGKNSKVLRVNAIKDLKVIINHFDNYPLMTQKRADFELFKQVIQLMEQGEHLTKEGLLKIVGIKASLNFGLSDTLKEAFPDIKLTPKKIIEFSKIKDINWLVGFAEGEGCFQVVIQNLGEDRINLRFTLTLHSRDKVLMESLVNYLNCGREYSAPKRNEVYFIVSKLSDINDKIIPLFEKHPLLGSKYQDYLDFAKVAKWVKSKDHLTNGGLKKN